MSKMHNKHRHNYELIETKEIGDLVIQIYKCKGMNCGKEQRFEKIVKK
jgi:hypothetical protein